MSAIVIDGSHSPEAFGAELARRYAAAHGDARVLAVRELRFDPVLHRGYRGAQPLEPDLVDARHAIEAADHLVVIAPVWWGSVPVLLKGFIDRVFLPRWAFRYRPSGLVTGLLAGRSGRVIVTTDSPIWYLHAVGDTTMKSLRGRTLRFSGIRPVAANRLGPVRGSTPRQRAAWLAEVEAVARRDRARAARRQGRLRPLRQRVPAAARA